MIKRIFLTFIYSLAYIFIHLEFLFEHFEYMGYEAYEHNPIYYIFLFLIILFPAITLYRKDDLFEFLFSFCYLLLYIPIIVTCYFHYNDISDFIFKGSVYLLSFFLIFRIPNTLMNPLRIKDGFSNLELKKGDTSGIFVLGVLVLLVLVFYFKDSISFVSFDKVYEHRAAVSFDLPIIGYLMLWNTYLIGPLIIIIGLYHKKRNYVALGIISILIFYGINASKIALFIPAMVVFCFYLIKSKLSIFNSIAICFIVLMYGCLFLPESWFYLKATILMRTFGITGLLTDQYDKFFQVNPYTYFTHINFVNFFANSYPYGDLPLGKVVSKFFDPNSDTNSNANFWAMDGYASLGTFGVILISVVFGFFLRFWKSLIDRNNIVYMTLMMVPFAFILLNVSLFTAILSGGYLFIIGYYYFKRIK